MNYSNTNKSLYDDIAIWEKTDGRDLFAQIPLAPHVKGSPTVQKALETTHFTVHSVHSI